MPTSEPPKDDSLQAGAYKQFTQDNQYTKVEGLALMGCADGTPVLVRAVKPYGLRHQSWTAQKDRTPPVFPAPRENDSDSTLLSKTFSVPMPRANPGTNPYYTFAISGNYSYLEQTPTDETQGFPGAKMPFQFPVLYEAIGIRWTGDSTLTIPMDFTQAGFSWPFTHIGVKFADPTLSDPYFVGLDADGLKQYQLDPLRRV